MTPDEAGRADPPPSGDDWLTYLQSHMDAQGWDQATLAREAGLDRSMVTYWFRGRKPNVESVRRCCRALRRDIREGLVAAGLLTAAELRIDYTPSPSPPSRALPDIRSFSDGALVGEIRRRLVSRNIPGTPAYEAAQPGAPVDGLMETIEIQEQEGTDALEVSRPPADAPDERTSR